MAELDREKLVEVIRNALWAVGKAVDHYSCHIATGETVLHGYAPTPAAALVAALLRAHTDLP